MNGPRRVIHEQAALAFAAESWSLARPRPWECWPTRQHDCAAGRPWPLPSILPVFLVFFLRGLPARTHRPAKLADGIRQVAKVRGADEEPVLAVGRATAHRRIADPAGARGFSGVMARGLPSSRIARSSLQPLSNRYGGQLHYRWIMQRKPAGPKPLRRQSRLPKRARRL